MKKKVKKKPPARRKKKLITLTCYFSEPERLEAIRKAVAELRSLATMMWKYPDRVLNFNIDVKRPAVPTLDAPAHGFETFEPGPEMHITFTASMMAPGRRDK